MKILVAMTLMLTLLALPSHANLDPQAGYRCSSEYTNGIYVSGRTTLSYYSDAIASNNVMVWVNFVEEPDKLYYIARSNGDNIYELYEMLRNSNLTGRPLGVCYQPNGLYSNREIKLLRW